MTDQIYYWESEDDNGRFYASDDSDAINFIKKFKHIQLLAIYKESPTPDGLPFIIVWKK